MLIIRKKLMLGKYLRVNLLLFSFNKLDPDRPIRKEKCVIGLLHSLSLGILQLEPVYDPSKHHIQVLLSKSGILIIIICLSLLAG